MMERPYRLNKVLLFMALALTLALFAGAADVAGAQTQPELSFLNGPLTMRAKPGSQEALRACPTGFEDYVGTATAYVFVLLSGSQEATNIRFAPEVPAVAKGRLTSTSYNQITTQNRIKVRSEPAQNDQRDRTIAPSKVKAFKLTFLICSNSAPPDLGYYVWNNGIPVEWSNLTGQLVVRDANKIGIAPGTVSMQMNRPAPGYEQTTFAVIWGITILLALLIAGLTYRGLDMNKWYWDYPADFKTTFVVPLTTATAILGTVISTTILPNDTFFMPRGEYAALNVLFGLVAVVSAVVHNNYDKAWSFWLAAWLTLGAASGEILTVVLILKEMGFQGSLPAQIVWIFQLLLVIIGFGLIAMSGIKVVKEINNIKPT